LAQEYTVPIRALFERQLNFFCNSFDHALRS